MTETNAALTKDALADLFSANHLIWVQGKTSCRWLKDEERDALLRILCSPDGTVTQDKRHD